MSGGVGESGKELVKGSRMMRVWVVYDCGEE